MTHRLTREELYNQVWAIPMQQLATQFGISDVALAKTCRRHHIPVPERGYWARRKVGKDTDQAALPIRPPGMSETVTIGGGTYGYTWNQSEVEAELLKPLPPPPSFSEDISAVRDRVRCMIGTVSVPNALHQPHKLIARLLDDDERRRQKQKNSSYPFSWDDPIFNTPAERRRLRVLNALFVAVERAGSKPMIRGREGKDLAIEVGQQSVGFTLDYVQRHRTTLQRDIGDNKRETGLLRLGILQSRGDKKERMSWIDEAEKAIEKQIGLIAVELVITGEIQYRESARHSYEWRIQRKAELEREIQQRKIEQERRERELQLKRERERVDRLLSEAIALQQANQIRGYVEAVRSANADSSDPVSRDEFDAWANWAFSVADQIDPIKAGAYRMLSWTDRKGIK